MKRKIICSVLVLVMTCLLQTVAFAESDFKKVGETSDFEVYLDKNSIVYYDDFIMIDGKNIALQGWISNLDKTLATEYYFKYALRKSAHSYKLLEVYARAEGVIDVDSLQLTQKEWLDKYWEYSEEEFHQRWDYHKKYDFNKGWWTDFGSNDELMTLVYEEAMKLAGIKNKHELEASETKQEAAAASAATSASSSSGTNILLVILAAVVGILGTILFMQYKNKK